MQAIFKSDGGDAFSVGEKLEAPDARVDLLFEAGYRLREEEIVG